MFPTTPRPFTTNQVGNDALLVCEERQHCSRDGSNEQRLAVVPQVFLRIFEFEPVANARGPLIVVGLVKDEKEVHPPITATPTRLHCHEIIGGLVGQMRRNDTSVFPEDIPHAGRSGADCGIRLCIHELRCVTIAEDGPHLGGEVSRLVDALGHHDGADEKKAPDDIPGV
jgi:hypothetical protein